MVPSTSDIRDDGRPLPASERYRLLGDARRRGLLAVLADRGAPVSLEALATILADEDGAWPDDRDAALASLYHAHVPVLADAGVVEYDPEARHVGACRMDPVRLLRD